jgi:photosynthetic reaction center H subunit
MSNELTSYIDVAQVTLYAFWIFFFGLIYWLRREDRREGYPLESDNPRRVGLTSNILFPAPKKFLLPHGGEVIAPDFERDTRDFEAKRTANASGAPYEPTGNPLLSNIGPASYAEREDEPELSREGEPVVVPLRVATDYDITAGPDPRGWKVVGTDGGVAGTVSDLWVDRADMMVRYLELRLEDEATEGETETGEQGAGAAGGPASTSRLVPITMLKVQSEQKLVDVQALRGEQFAHVPTLKDPNQITLHEEERISAFYAGGNLYADRKREEPLV